jgi:hypothetical protein
MHTAGMAWDDGGGQDPHSVCNASKDDENMLIQINQSSQNNVNSVLGYLL